MVGLQRKRHRNQSKLIQPRVGLGHRPFPPRRASQAKFHVSPESRSIEAACPRWVRVTPCRRNRLATSSACWGKAVESGLNFRAGIDCRPAARGGRRSRFSRMRPSDPLPTSRGSCLLDGGHMSRERGLDALCLDGHGLRMRDLTAERHFAPGCLRRCGGQAHRAERIAAAGLRREARARDTVGRGDSGVVASVP